MRSSKIDRNLLNNISVLSNHIKTPCFIYYKDLNMIRLLLARKKIHILNEYLFINAVFAYASRSDIFSLSVAPEVEFISSLSTACCLMKVSRDILESDKIKLTGKGVNVAFIDTGIAPHCDFCLAENRIKFFKDFVGGGIQPYDDNGHGTFVCGVCSGGGYLSAFKYAGIAPKSNLFVLKALNSNGEATANKILDAMEWVYDNHEKENIKVVCMSFGSEPIGINDPIMLGANALWEDGVVVVAAAGNSGPDNSTIKSPGISPNIITVGGFDDNRFDNDTFNKNYFEMAQFSSRGPALRHYKPDLIAPSVDIISCGRNEIYTTLSGTSVATPMIAGIVALMFEKEPNLLPATVKRKLLQSCNTIGFDINSEGYGVPKLTKIFR